jgi:hypothetical protein
LKWLFCGALLPAIACGSGSKGGSSPGSDDGAPTDDTAGSGAPVTDTSTTVGDTADGDTAVDDTDSGGGADGGDTGSGYPSYTIVPLDEGDYTTLTPSTEMIGGWSLGESLALTSDLWGDGRPEVVSSAFYDDGYGDAISTTYVFDSEFFSSGPKDGVANDEARMQIDTVNGGANSYPGVIGDLDGDGLDELALEADGWGAASVLIRGDHLATLSGLIEREDLDRDADMTFTGCPGGFARVWHSGHLSDPAGLQADIVVDCWGDIVVLHGSDLYDGENRIGDEGQARIYNTDTWGGSPVVEGDRLYEPTILGDLDGDGLYELAIPMWSKSEPYNYIFYGDSLNFEAPTSTTDADIVFKTPDAVSWGDHATFYFQPTPLSDVNGDGVADVLWSSGYAQADDREDVGIAWLWSGARLASPMVGEVGDADVTFTADLPYSYVGDSAADAGDVDGDSLSDLLIHSSGYDAEDAINLQPCAHLVLGAKLIGGGSYNLDQAGIGFVPQDDGYRNLGPGAGEYAGGQDLDGDGVGDLLIGNSDWTGLDYGRIWMIPGGTLPL